MVGRERGNRGSGVDIPRSDHSNNLDAGERTQKTQKESDQGREAIRCAKARRMALGWRHRGSWSGWLESHPISRVHALAVAYDVLVGGLEAVAILG